MTNGDVILSAGNTGKVNIQAMNLVANANGVKAAHQVTLDASCMNRLCHAQPDSRRNEDDYCSSIHDQ